jgi:diaminopimelate epimerase
MKIAPYDVFGNRLLVAAAALTDDELCRSSELARRCFVRSRRIADGIALFSPRAGFLRTAFYNPDGSFERLCGNSLLVAARHFVTAGQTALVRPFDLPPIELAHSVNGSLEARSELILVPRSVEVPGFGPAPVYDTGSPHAVVSATHHAFELETIGAFVSNCDVNLTVVQTVGHVLCARTLERGVGAETAACGTGALAVAIASERFDEWLEIRYRTGRYAVLIRRAGKRLAWTLCTEAAAVKSEDPAILTQEDAGPSVSGSSSTRCST